MSKTYLPYQPTQSFLLPTSPLDWLPEDHLSRFILDTVGELDLSELFSYYERELRDAAGSGDGDVCLYSGLKKGNHCVYGPQGSSQRLQRKQETN